MNGSVQLQTSSSTTTIGGAISDALDAAKTATEAANTANENANTALDSANASVSKVEVEYYDSTSATEL